MVASNLPMSSDGSSIFSVGKSSMGIKSSSASGKTGLSSGVGWGAATTFAGFCFFGSVVSTLVSAGTVLGVFPLREPLLVLLCEDVPVCVWELQSLLRELRLRPVL